MQQDFSDIGCTAHICLA